MRAARQPGRQRRQGLRGLTLLLCLLALSRGARAQGIFEMLTGAATTAPAAGTTATPAATTTAPATTAPTTTVPATADPATTTAPATTGATAAPATTGATAAPAATTGATAAPAATIGPALLPATDATAAPATGAMATPAAGATTAAPATGATTAAPATGATTGAVATGTASDVAPSFGTLAPAAATGAGAGAAPALNAGQVQAGTPAVATTNGSDIAPVADVGTVATAVTPPPVDTLPPSPPEAWQALQKDVQLVFDVEIRGKYIVPFTSPKAKVIARVLRDRYLRSAQLPDITVGALSTFTYMSFDSPTESADAVAVSGGGTGSRRRLLARLGGAWGGAGRDLLQLEKSGAELKIVVATNQVRVDSEIASFEEGVNSGSMAADFTLAGIDTENLTLLAVPHTEDLIGPGNTEETNDSMQAWVIAVIVAVVLLIIPAPLFFIVRWRKRKNKEAQAMQAAEAEAARLRMQSRIMRPGSKSFSLKQGGSSGSADIMVRSGSIGGLAGYHNNGRLQSWSGSPDRTYGQYAISRQTSVTSMGSAMPSARSFGGRPGSQHGLPPFSSPITIHNGAYEESELQTARTSRSDRG